MVKEYEKLNQYLWAPIYKTDYELLNRIWSERIDEKKSEFSLFVASSEEVFSGFIALQLHKERGEVLMIVLESSASQEDYQELFEFALESLKEQGAKIISFEVAPFEAEYLSILERKGAKQLSSKYIL